MATANQEDFQGGGSSIANLRNTQQHPAQQKQQMMQQAPQGQPIPQQPPQQMNHRQQMPPQQMMQQRPTQPIQTMPIKESFVGKFKNYPWKKTATSFAIMLFVFLLFTNPIIIKKICKNMVPIDKQTKQTTYIIFLILATISSTVVTVINHFALYD